MPANFHGEILTREQEKLLPLVKSFNKDFGLVGGTAIALHIGHRESIDFDLFSLKEFENFKIRNKIAKNEKIGKVFVDELGEFTVLVKGVKITFLHYPFPLKFSENFRDIIKLPNLLTLSAMKAYALGRRPKWKDYVDLYFIMKKKYSLAGIVGKAEGIFGNEFNEKLFRQQLSYFDDIDYSEKIIWKTGFEISDETIKSELAELSLSQTS